MAHHIDIHPQTPQLRLVSQAADILRAGGVAVYPTDSCYALGCRIGDKEALDRIRQIRHLDERHNMTLMCEDLSEIAIYAKVSNPAFRLMKSLTPGPYTFLLLATRNVPRRLQHPKRKTIGVRVPDNSIALALLADLGEPVLSTSLILPGEALPMNDPAAISRHLGKRVDMIIAAGAGGLESTSVIDLTGNHPVVVREGKGSTANIGT